MDNSESTYSEDFSFSVPTKYKASSKLILDDKRIINIIVNQIIGQQALDQYVPMSTKWLNFNKLDVLYKSSDSNNSDTLPPVVVEVQYTGNMSFYHRLIEHGLSVTKQHSASPVILAIVIHNTTTELANLAVASEKHPFLLELPCHGWAKSCYLLNSSSISEYLQLASLSPLVALGHFLIKQKPSLRSIDRNDDKTIQLIYTIVQEIFDGGLKQSESLFMEEVHDQCTQAKSYLLNDVLDENSRKRTIDCLDQLLNKINELRKKSTRSVLSSNKTLVNKDWQFIDKYYEDHGSFNWEVMFTLGKANNLFNTYSKWTTCKSAYYRFQKKNSNI